MSTKVNYRTIFAQKEYMKIVLAAIINRFGDSVDAVAYTWLVYELTGNAGWSALIFGLNKLPSVFVTPFAGAWVEGHKKKQIMIGTDLIRALCVAAIATTYLYGVLQPWLLVVTTLVISTVEAFRGPASTALTPQVLKKEYYEYGMSLLSSATTVVEIVGTAAAAGIIAVIGTSGAIYVDMTTFLLSALVIVFVRVREENLQTTAFDVGAYKTTFTEGVGYVCKNGRLVFLVGACVFLNAILVPFNSLQAPLVQEILGAAATPVTSFLVSALAVQISTEYIFLAAGLLDVVGCGCMMFSKLLAEEETVPA